MILTTKTLVKLFESLLGGLVMNSIHFRSLRKPPLVGTVQTAERKKTTYTRSSQGCLCAGSDTVYQEKFRPPPVVLGIMIVTSWMERDMFG